MSVKLPKQWKHWCKLMRLKPEYRGRYKCKYDHFSLVGRGHRWRVNMYGQFQMSEPYEQFDRWANSVERTVDMPKTKKEFMAAVNHMLGRVQDRKTGEWYKPDERFMEVMNTPEVINVLKRLVNK